jgi:hypothetical protein
MTGNTALLGCRSPGRLAAAERAFAALIGFCCGSSPGRYAAEHAGRQRAAIAHLFFNTTTTWNKGRVRRGGKYLKLEKRK